MSAPSSSSLAGAVAAEGASDTSSALAEATTRDKEGCSVAPPAPASTASTGDTTNNVQQPELELHREQAYPHYLPATGTGSKMRDPDPAVLANSRPASYFPPFTASTGTTQTAGTGGSAGAGAGAGADKAAAGATATTTAATGGGASSASPRPPATLTQQLLQQQRPDLAAHDSHLTTASSDSLAAVQPPLSTSGIATPSTSFGYSPALSASSSSSRGDLAGFETPPLESGDSVASRGPSMLSRSSAAAPSSFAGGASAPPPSSSAVPASNSVNDDKPAPPLSGPAKAEDAMIRSMDSMELEGMEGITIVPSTRPGPVDAIAKQTNAPSTHSPLVNAVTATSSTSTSTVTPTAQSAIPPPSSSTTTATTRLAPSSAAAAAAAAAPPSSARAASPAPSHQSRPAASSVPSATPSAHQQQQQQLQLPSEKRPAPPEHKKSMLGKLFSRGDKDHSNQSSATPSPHPTQDNRDYPHQQNLTSGVTTVQKRGSRSNSASKSKEQGGLGATASAYTSGAESDTSSVPHHHHQSMNRSPSGTTATRDQQQHHPSGERERERSAFGNFLARRTSNKKLDKPDSTLAAMASKNASKSNSALDTTGVSPNASNTALLHPAVAGGPSSTVASRGSTPDLNTAPGTPGAVATPGGTRVAATASPARGREEAGGGGRAMMRRPSGSAHDGHRGVVNGAHTPVGEGQPVKEKSLKEHLAALGSSAGIGKLNRKTSQTSRRSDDGRSEKSVHHDDYQSGGEGGTTGHGHAPKRAPSVGAASNASTSLLKKYGVCEKVAIGKGATAVVRLAHKWDRSTEKLYAVKEFRKRRKNESEKEYVKKLTSEFCISSTLHHVNVVETVDLVQNEDKHWCEVMEYCPGGDLYAAIKRGDMSNEVMNVYFKQIVTGVAYLHSMGVAHRDIKPENLLLDGRGHVKITDFGVSDVFRMCWEKQTHMSKGLCGSEPYIAPEQFEQKEYDARLVDVWACAVVFYCMQAQELPWRVAKPNDPSFQTYLQNYATSSSPAPLGNLHPKECRAIIKKMLDPNPKTRYSMDAVLADPFMKSIDYTAEPVEHPKLT